MLTGYERRRKGRGGEGRGGERKGGERRQGEHKLVTQVLRGTNLPFCYLHSSRQCGVG